MPISGSGDRQYFYPGVHNPVSSYPSVDIRGGGTQTTAPGTGRLYVLSSSGDLYFKDPDGNEIVVAAGGGSGENVFDNVYVSSSLLVKGDTVLSGNVVVGGQLYDLNSNLILSSSVGSVIAASSSLDFPNIDKAYHIRAVNSKLLLSSSAGSAVYISGNLQASGSHTLTGTLNLFDGIDERSTGAYHLRAVNSGLVLSSSANSAVYVSGNLQASGSHTLTGSLNLFDGIDSRGLGAYHFRAVNDKLILSSSAGSVVYISGNLQASGSHTFTGSIGLLDGVDSRGVGSYHLRSVNDKLILSSSAGSAVYISGNFQASGSHTLTGSLNLFDGIDERSTGAYHLRAVNSPLILSSSVGSYVYISGNLQASGSHTFTGSVSVNDNLSLTLDSQYNIRNSVSHLILSSSVGSIIAASSSLDFPNIDKAYHIRAVNNRLILSSSVGSVVALSSNLYFPVDAPSTFAHITANNSHLILSSSAGSAVKVSGNFDVLGTLTQNGAAVGGAASILSSSGNSIIAGSGSIDFSETNKNYHIRTTNSDLVLSSSTSLVYVSGTQNISQQPKLGLLILGRTAFSATSTTPNGVLLDVFNSSQYPSFAEGTDWKYTLTSSFIDFTASNGRFSVVKNGNYVVHSFLSISGNNAGQAKMSILLNDNSIYKVHGTTHSSLPPSDFSLLTLVTLNANDYINVTVQLTGSSTEAMSIRSGSCMNMWMIS